MTRFLGRIIIIYTFSPKQSRSSLRDLGKLGQLCLTIEGKKEFLSDEMLENKKMIFFFFGFASYLNSCWCE